MLQVFGNYSSELPAAFGDFNGDKLTDIVVLYSPGGDDVITVRLLLAKEQKVVTSASVQDPLFHRGTRAENLQCNLPKVRGTNQGPGLECSST